jgi:hypothetical protein
MSTAIVVNVHMPLRIAAFIRMGAVVPVSVPIEMATSFIVDMNRFHRHDGDLAADYRRKRESQNHRELFHAHKYITPYSILKVIRKKKERVPACPDFDAAVYSRPIIRSERCPIYPKLRIAPLIPK